MRDNAGWRFDLSLVKVKTYIEACDAWLSTPVAEMESSGLRSRLEPRIVQENMRDAYKWYSLRAKFANRPRTLYADTSNFQESC